MFVIVAIFGAVILLTFLFTDARRSGKNPKQSEPLYNSKQKLFSPAEATFFGVLKLALGDDFHIFSKVRVADLLEPAGPGSQWRSAFNRISSKHLDFVVCKTGSWDIIAVVELDDASHSRRDRAARDAFMDSSLQNAGIPIVRVKAKATYAVPELRNQIQQTIRRAQNPKHPIELELEQAALAC